ncbi:Zinc-finger domain of monoamine-oxidase A repressor R1 protein [Rhynchospora pubera]|uniref:Zinc-finger domain of monoamine-oxidase A repressor R1 protein n=1 Tax=Rhynchospora pubera TaxID=906938 RepID=A0AAV8DUU8_9POAL|nr:Zinc-finger domain of monoamine-oxidase A repressor R1 protein [Rhynchospora pubera]
MAVTTSETNQTPEATTDAALDQALIAKKPPSKRKRNPKPGVRVVGGRIYDPQHGKTCHQCRQKTMDFMVACTQLKKDKLCTIKFCHKCLFNRYGEKAEEMAKVDSWKCPKCRGICNCSFCMKKNGNQPTGIMVHTAKANGYSSVSELLEKRGSDFIKASPKVPTPKKRKHEEDKENKGEEPKVKKQLFKKPRKEGRKKSDKQDPTNDLEMKENVEGMSNSSVKIEKVAKPKPHLRKHNEADVAKKRLKELKDKISTLPRGTRLSEIIGIEMDPEDIGPAVQFLEFCSIFSKIFNIKKGQPECILQEIVRGRVGRRGLSAASMQLQISLLSAIQIDRGERPVSRSAKKGAPWFKSLQNFISESEYYFKGLPKESLSDGILGYDNLASYWKLRILNFLCDEVLSTEKLRGFMDSEIMKSKEEKKMDGEKLLAAKRKEREIKEKLKNEMAKAVLSEMGGANLTIEEHANMVSKIKEDAENAHAELLETLDSLSLKTQRSSLRTEPMILEGSGRVYWKLNGLSNNSVILLQDVESWHQLENGDKWYHFSEDDEKTIERHISSVRKWQKILDNALRPPRKEKKSTPNQDQKPSLR